MAGPFHNNIRGGSSGAAGTSTFTPSGVVTGGIAWSTVPAGWIGLVRFEDGVTAELRYCYWNGTTLTRGANAFVWSTSGAVLNLTSAATASMVADGGEVQTHNGGTPWSGIFSVAGAATILGFAAPVNTNIGTVGAAQALATTNFLTEQPRVQLSSATTANAQAGENMGTVPRVVHSTTAGRGGGEFVCRFGASQLPVGPRLFVGFSATTFTGVITDPSAPIANYAGFAKDAADTNIQFLTNSNAGAGTKIDTGIALVANGWYEASVWFDPGGGRMYGLLIRIDTGEIWYGSTTTDIPANGALMFGQLVGGLSATTGTAFVMQFGSMAIRTGG